MAAGKVTDRAVARLAVIYIRQASRQRSGRDWYQLMELCAISGALLADTDGVYDPGDYNDRLVAPTTTGKDRKEIIRALVQDVTLTCSAAANASTSP